MSKLLENAVIDERIQRVRPLLPSLPPTLSLLNNSTPLTFPSLPLSLPPSLPPSLGDGLLPRDLLAHQAGRLAGGRTNEGAAVLLVRPPSHPPSLPHSFLKRFPTVPPSPPPFGPFSHQYKGSEHIHSRSLPPSLPPSSRWHYLRNLPEKYAHMPINFSLPPFLPPFLGGRTSAICPRSTRTCPSSTTTASLVQFRSPP